MPRRRPAHAAWSLVVAACLLAGGAACKHDGRTLAPTRPGQTTTTRPASTAATAPTSVFTLTSPDAPEGGVLPARFTCAGEGRSPGLAWTSTPPAQELALVVRDRDADGYVHWILTGIDPTTTSLGQGGTPESAVEQVNSEGSVGWLAPCPPVGGGRHVYDFAIHALSAPIAIDPSLPAADAAAKIETASVGVAKLSVSVTR